MTTEAERLATLCDSWQHRQMSEVAAELRRLQAEVRELQNTCAAQAECIAAAAPERQELQREVLALQAENVALRRDAERYRWLKEHMLSVDCADDESYAGNIHLEGERGARNLDAAIDAAKEKP